MKILYKIKMKRKTDRGFTLIEIIIALTIFTVGIVAILSLFMLGFDAAMRSSDLTKAGIYGQWVMEDQKRIGYVTLAAVAPGTAFPGGFDPRFTYQVQVQNATDEIPPGPPNLRRVTVIVSWNYKGQPYNETFATYIPNYAP